VRGYILVGDQDHECLGVSRKVVEILNTRGIPCELEARPGLGHSYPADFVEVVSKGLSFNYNSGDADWLTESHESPHRMLSLLHKLQTEVKSEMNALKQGLDSQPAFPERFLQSHRPAGPR